MIANQMGHNLKGLFVDVEKLPEKFRRSIIVFI